MKIGTGIHSASRFLPPSTGNEYNTGVVGPSGRNGTYPTGDLRPSSPSFAESRQDRFPTSQPAGSPVEAPAGDHAAVSTSQNRSKYW